MGYPSTVIECSRADPGFQVRGGALKKIAPSGGRRENFGESFPFNYMLKSKLSLSRHFEYANKQITYHFWLCVIFHMKYPKNFARLIRSVPVTLLRNLFPINILLKN
jgi:hypothetical protein